MLEVDGNFWHDIRLGWLSERFRVVLLVVSFVELMVRKVYFFMQHEYVIP
jgi:hypothetical protein